MSPCYLRDIIMGDRMADSGVQHSTGWLMGGRLIHSGNITGYHPLNGRSIESTHWFPSMSLFSSGLQHIKMKINPKFGSEVSSH